MSTRCEHPDCIAIAIGYVSRQLQGPFYCEAHRNWAVSEVDKFWEENEKYLNMSAEDINYYEGEVP